MLFQTMDFHTEFELGLKSNLWTVPIRE